MLAAVSGLAYLLSTILKLDSSLGYFLPLPVVLAAMRGGVAAGWRTMSATGFLLVGGCMAGPRLWCCSHACRPHTGQQWVWFRPPCATRAPCLLMYGFELVRTPVRRCRGSCAPAPGTASCPLRPTCSRTSSPSARWLPPTHGPNLMQ